MHSKVDLSGLAVVADHWVPVLVLDDDAHFMRRNMQRLQMPSGRCGRRVSCPVVLILFSF